MIDSISKLNECLSIEKQLYQEIGYKGRLHAYISKCEVGALYEYMRVLRKDEYYTNKMSCNVIDKVKSRYYRRKHNIMGIKLGISIPVNTFGKGLLIYHSQGIIVHKDSRCGEFCKLHGMNCIGNNGTGDGCNNVPQIGDCVDIGVGAIIIGNVHLAGHTKLQQGVLFAKILIQNIKFWQEFPQSC